MYSAAATGALSSCWVLVVTSTSVSASATGLFEEACDAGVLPPVVVPRSCLFTFPAELLLPAPLPTTRSSFGKYVAMRSSFRDIPNCCSAPFKLNSVNVPYVVERSLLPFSLQPSLITALTFSRVYNRASGKGLDCREFWDVAGRTPPQRYVLDIAR